MVRASGRSTCTPVATRRPGATSGCSGPSPRRTREPARRFVDQALAALIVGVETGRINLGEDPTLTELLDRWLAARSPEWSPKTVMENRRNIELKIRPRPGKMRVSKVRSMHLDAFYAELRESGGAKGQPLAPASVRKVHVILHAAFAQAIKWGPDRVEPG